MPRPEVGVFVADCETTGPKLDDRIVELAWIHADQELNKIEVVHSRIDPEKEIAFAAQGIHGITPTMVEHAPTIEQFFRLVLPADSVPEKVIFVAHNSRFDRRYFEPHLPIAAELCTLRLARKYLPVAEDHKLTTLRYQFGLHKGVAHSALDDALACLDLLKFIVSLAEKPFLQLVDEMKNPQRLEVCPLGKFKGRPMGEVESDYARWALRNMKDLDPDLKWSLELVRDGKF